MIKRFVLLVFLLVLALPAQAQAEPVVFGVFFYSPTCPHCHKVLTEDWPGIQETFGSQLQVLLINVTTYDGAQILQFTRDAGLLTDDQKGVPMLLIGENVLIGSVDIPAMTPDIVREGLAAGGIDFPPIPGIRDLYDRAVAAAQAQVEPTAASSAENSEATTSAPQESLPAVAEALTLSERLAADPVANALAIAVLAGLVISLFVTVVAGTRLLTGAMTACAAPITHHVVMVVLLVAAGLTLTLVLGGAGEKGEKVLAGAATHLLAGGSVIAWRNRKNPGGLLYRSVWLVPFILIAGVIVAGYLTYVEVTANDAVCGIVGDCNAVQQSPYAVLFGVLPVGVVGLVGYIGLLLVWLWGKATRSRAASLLLLGMAVIGVIFSLYLTFLEPFVIGATCVWCLTSAVIMIALLWLFMPEGLMALVSTRNHTPGSGEPAVTHA